MHNITNEARQQFITFLSDDQEYGANIMAIREIRGWTETTPLPHAPAYVRGVINLRGVVLPVIDLKARLGRELTATNPKHVIIVVDDGSRTFGVLVDAVSDILTARAGEIQQNSRSRPRCPKRLRRGHRGDGAAHGDPALHEDAGPVIRGPRRGRGGLMLAMPREPLPQASLVPDSEFAFTLSDFRKIAALVHGQAGIVLPESKASLVYSRLAKRLRTIGLRSFRDYCALVESKDGVDERMAMIAAMTTNVTRFFRESHHFEELSTILPAMAQAARKGQRLRLWSAGCSWARSLTPWP